MALNPLGIVKNIVEEAGMGISYVYEDLVYLEHNAFLLQFTDNENEVLLHINSEADGKSIGGDIQHLVNIAHKHAMLFTKGQFYTLSQGEGETLHLEFHDTVQ